MGEYRALEHDEVNRRILEHADPKYTHAVVHEWPKDWCTADICYLFENFEDADAQAKCETEAYGDPEYVFEVRKIHKEKGVTSKVYFSLKNVEH